jgi:hypothetical protein
MVSPITATTALNLNQEMTDFNYKKYSLENLENWLHDAMSAGEATPQEIYDVIVGVVKENYYIYKHQTSQAYELLALLNSGVGNNKYQDYLNEILSCDKDDPSPECKGAWNDFWESNNTVEYDLREAEYYNKEVFVSEDGDLYPTRDKVVKWQLPVQLDGLTGDCYINLPDDLLEAANLKEGDTVEWIDRNDGSFELRKVNGTK